jgi:hypothetical protein
MTYELDGTVDQRYAPEGLACQIVLPLDRVLAKPGRLQASAALTCSE